MIENHHTHTMERIVAIDFELANRHYLSACAVGVVVLEDGVVVFEQGFLIKPPVEHGHFIPEFVAIHHIQPQDIVSAMTFDQLFVKLEPYINQATLVAHNAPFDMGILRALLDYYGLGIQHSHYVCTVALSRVLFRSLKNHKLNTVADHLSISLDHHQAHSDANACLQIVAFGMSLLQVDTIESLCLKTNVRRRRFV